MLSQGGDDLKKRKKYIVISVILIILIIVFLLLLRSCQSTTTKPEADVTTMSESNSLDFTPYGETSDTITIPAVDGLNLKAGQLNQQIDFYNPAKNKCYFKISLYLSDNTLIWHSNYLAPSERISEISLNQELHRGVYKNCRLVYDCFSLTDKSPLNSGSVKLEINSY